jgi:hypothetical protein
LGQQIVPVKAIGEAIQVEQLEHRKHHEKEPHAIQHPFSRAPAIRAMSLFCRRGQKRQRDQNQQW